MKLVATTSLPEVDRLNADRWNASRSRQYWGKCLKQYPNYHEGTSVENYIQRDKRIGNKKDCPLYWTCEWILKEKDRNHWRRGTSLVLEAAGLEIYPVFVILFPPPLLLGILKEVEGARKISYFTRLEIGVKRICKEPNSSFSYNPNRILNYSDSVYKKTE